VNRQLVVRVSRRLRKLHASAWAIKLCKSYSVSFNDVIGTKSRVPTVVRVRHEIWCVVLDTFGMSFPEVAEIFEVDHTTVCHAYNRRHAFTETSYGHHQSLQ
jgi:chromosomal replication initiation ATPase DnaA